MRERTRTGRRPMRFETGAQSRGKTPRKMIGTLLRASGEKGVSRRFGRGKADLDGEEGGAVRGLAVGLGAPTGCVSQGEEEQRRRGDSHEVGRLCDRYPPVLGKRLERGDDGCGAERAHHRMKRYLNEQDVFAPRRPVVGVCARERERRSGGVRARSSWRTGGVTHRSGRRSAARRRESVSTMRSLM